MRIIVTALFCIFLSCISLQTGAAESKWQLGSKLANLLQVRGQFGAYLKHCTNPKDTYLDPAFILTTEPEAFGGITQKSVYWPEVVRIYARFQKTVCSYISVEQFESFYIQQLVEGISEADLKETIKFYSTESGRRFQRASALVNDAFQLYASEKMKEVYRVAYSEVSTEMKPLISKFQSNQE